MAIISLYKLALSAAQPVASLILRRRLSAGKEDPARYIEKKGKVSLPRPDGRLLWLHAASVGEAQSALILIRELLARDKTLNILVTTGTKTSAAMMEQNLPARAMHQYAPLDVPAWVERFLNHWQPNAAIWMESELWPATIEAIGKRGLPLALVNARLSPKSYGRWKTFKPLARHMLAHFDAVLCQTQRDSEYFRELGAKNIIVTDNLKYGAAALPVNEDDLNDLKQAINLRPVWVYASTHAGEEELACRVHSAVKQQVPDLLTIIVPRHPERGAEIEKQCTAHTGYVRRRGADKALPDGDTDIYIADTLGELGLFYRLAPVACIGRSFSDDGGGGHNPLEAALLDCAVLHGPNVQNLQDIFDDMNAAGTAQRVSNEAELSQTLRELLSDPKALQSRQERAKAYALDKSSVLDRVTAALPDAVLKGNAPA